MSHFDKHIFICENIREGENARVSCGKQNSKKIRELLKQKLGQISTNQKIRVNMAGCLDRCEEGPVQVCYPEGTWFALKSEEDVDLFIEEYIQKENITALKVLK